MTAANRWAILTVSVLAQTGTSFYQFGVPYLLPQIQADLGGSLFQGAVLVAAPTAGMVVTLLPWGYAADRIGDRPVMVAGLVGAVLALAMVPLATDLVQLGLLLCLAGGSGASVNVTSGRVVLKSFEPRRRGLAMGIRQTSPLLGMGLAALTLPGLTAAFGYQTALLAPALVCLVAAIQAAVVLGSSAHHRGRDREPGVSPYREARLWLLHGASALLVIPQIAVASFAFIYLVTVSDWRPFAGGVAVAVAMVGGAGLRLLAGAWSDRVQDRTGPMRILAFVGFAVLALTAVLMAGDPGWVAVGLLPAAGITAAWNGLAFTAVAETAGPSWAGRALGLQNSIQYVTTAATPPAMALAIGSGRYAVAFLGASLAGLAAAFLVPTRVPTEAPGVGRSLV